MEIGLYQLLKKSTQMNLTYTKRIEYNPFDNDDKKSIDIILEELKGGSAQEYAIDPEKFNVNNFYVFRKSINTGNTLDINFLDLLDELPKEIVFIDVFCVENTDTMVKKIPIRFRLSLAVSTPVEPIDLGYMSNFNMSNISNNQVIKLSVSGITVPSGKTATLVVCLGTSDTQGTFETV